MKIGFNNLFVFKQFIGLKSAKINVNVRSLVHVFRGNTISKTSSLKPYIDKCTTEAMNNTELITIDLNNIIMFILKVKTNYARFMWNELIELSSDLKTFSINEFKLPYINIQIIKYKVSKCSNNIIEEPKRLRDHHTNIYFLCPSPTMVMNNNDKDTIMFKYHLNTDILIKNFNSQYVDILYIYLYKC
ncbi:hypothetical protein AGLY_007168 [Aphis glycines]|uniref:Uncharacterized protein n=1 Tax=Aphis glycines TaxID=307491 RepID=A0A6G0TNT3_APHGL|nr:hypothetical protein AGLY_007168 [Aphis glycines]